MKETSYPIKHITVLCREIGEFIYCPVDCFYTFYDAIRDASDYFEGCGVCEFTYMYEYEQGSKIGETLFSLTF